MKNEAKKMEGLKTKELKDRDNLDLFELICELSGRNALHNTKSLHDAYFEARNEFEKRLRALEKERDELKESRDAAINRWGDLDNKFQALKDAIREHLKLLDELKEAKAIKKLFNDMKDLIK